MAGHSQFKNIMHRKGAQDAKRAKIFTKIIREITVAVKEGGSEVDSNPRLRGALASAREANMPKDNVDRAIKKALGGEEGTDYTSVRYEGYGPGGIALIVEALTDNRNRTAAEIRSAFNKYGGALGEPNSVSFQFDRLGVISFMAPVATPEVIFEAALEAGAEDVESDTTGHIVKTSLESFHRVRDQLAARFGEPNSSKVLWEPRNLVAISTDKAPSLLKLIDVLEDNDDVQEVSANFDLDEAAMKELQAN